MEKVILLKFNFLIPSLRYIRHIFFYMRNKDTYYFLSNI